VQGAVQMNVGGMDKFEHLLEPFFKFQKISFHFYFNMNPKAGVDRHVILTIGIRPDER
jgi:hypothetical protein